MSRAVCCWGSCTAPGFGHLLVCEDHARTIWQYVQKFDDDAKVHAPPTPRPSGAHERHGWVYYLNVGGRLKIGFEKERHSRLRAYPPGTEVLGHKRGTLADEQAEHQRCTPWRIAGREWYELNDATRRVIDEANRAESDRIAAKRAAAVPPPRPQRPHDGVLRFPPEVQFPRRDTPDLDL